MSREFNVGDLSIHRIIEQETTFLPALDLFPQLTPDLLAQNKDRLRKIGAIDDSDTLILCFQSYVVRTPHHTILIDSCIGNDKPRPLRPKWNMKTDDTYMHALKAAGFSVDDIDFVMCTHLHVDHVGWNTRMDNGRWVPTFPKARYLFARTEWEHWSTEEDAGARRIMADSVQPVLDAGLATLVETDHRVSDELWLEHTPGHTPGHVSVRLSSGDGEAVITGDL